MKIGIDARFLTHPQTGGFKTYTTNLVRALCETDRCNEYVIYVDRQAEEQVVPRADNFIYRVVDGTLPGVGMPVREQLRLPRYIAEDNPDVVHFLCNTAPARLPANSIVTLHDTIQIEESEPLRLSGRPSHYKRWAMAAYSKWTILKTARAADQIVTVSAYEKEKIGQCLNISPQRICVTHLAANPIFSAASTSMLEQWRVTLGRRLHLPDRFILGIGYEPRKNIELLVDLFAQLAPCFPELGLVIVVAEESRRSLLSQRVSDRGVADRAILLPAMSPKELLALYNLAEVFVYPSQRESFGLPPLEAIACGTPTIAMNLASLPEILEDGALLIDGQDSETWANAVTQVLANDEIRKALIDRGLRRASKFTWKRCAQTTLDVYRSVA